MRDERQGINLSQVGAKLRRGPEQFFHWCPACKDMHPLPDSWLFVNRNLEKPTFQPSFSQTFTYWTGEPGSEEARRTREKRVCHYVITAGQIHFCDDSWHGRTDVVEMPDIPEHLRTRESY